MHNSQGFVRACWSVIDDNGKLVLVLSVKPIETERGVCVERSSDPNYLRVGLDQAIKGRYVTGKGHWFEIPSYGLFTAAFSGSAKDSKRVSKNTSVHPEPV